MKFLTSLNNKKIVKQSEMFRGYHLPEFCEIFQKVIQDFSTISCEDQDDDFSFECFVDSCRGDELSEDESSSSEGSDFTPEKPNFMNSNNNWFLVNLYKEIIRRENIALLEWLIAVRCPINISVINFAIDKGRGLRLAKHLIRESVKAKIIKFNHELYASIASVGDIEFIKEFSSDVKRIRNLVPYAYLKCAYQGKLHMLKWFDEQQYEEIICEKKTFRNDLCAAAAAGSNDESQFVEYVFLQSGCPITEEALVQAAKRGYIKVFKWLLKNGRGTSECRLSERICKTAAIHGHLEFLKYALKKHIPFVFPGDINVIDKVIDNEDLVMLDFLISQMTSTLITFSLCRIASYAARKGKIEALKLFVKAGFQIPANVCINAASEGHLECLIFLREVCGCQWNTLTTKYAASGGHLECLMYAYENGCKWDEEIFEDVIRGNRFDCLKYIVEKDPELIKVNKEKLAEMARRKPKILAILGN